MNGKNIEGRPDVGQGPVPEIFQKGGVVALVFYGLSLTGGLLGSYKSNPFSAPSFKNDTKAVLTSGGILST